MTTKKWVKSIIGIVTSLLINDLHSGEMLLGTDVISNFESPNFGKVNSPI